MSPQNNAPPSNLDIVFYVQRERRRLPEEHHAFVNDADHIARGWGPTEMQRKYLRHLFFSLGGKIT